MDDPEFRRGEIDIQWLERRLPSLLEVKPPAESARLAAIAATLLAERDRTAPRRAAAATNGANGDSEWTRLARLEALR